jgi:hypothetical protein
MDAF